MYYKYIYIYRILLTCFFKTFLLNLKSHIMNIFLSPLSLSSIRFPLLLSCLLPLIFFFFSFFFSLSYPLNILHFVCSHLIFSFSHFSFFSYFSHFFLSFILSSIFFSLLAFPHFDSHQPSISGGNFPHFPPCHLSFSHFFLLIS